MLFETDAGDGVLFGGLEIAKTTDIGRFDDYVGPLLATEARRLLHLRNTKGASGNNAGNINQVSDYIRSGHRNLGLKYAGRAGWKLTVGYESKAFYKLEDRGLRFSAFRTFDVNSLKAFAPQGVGVLIDPTFFKAEARIEDFGLSLEAPVHVFKSSGHQHTTYLGVGAIHNRTRSHGVASSDFLDISIVETRVIDRPLFSLAYRLRPLRQENAPPLGFDVSAQLFRTSKMFNLNLSAALVKSFY